MSVTEFNRHQTPNGGWVFRQPETGWVTPTPIGSTFDQTVMQIIAMRKKNPAITAKHKLATNREAVASELERYTRKRLGLSEAGTPAPFPVNRSNPVARAVAAAVDKVSDDIAGLKRAAQGTSVITDWLRNGGTPVVQELADKRASICIKCPNNVAGSWFTTAAAEIIKETLEMRKDVNLETPFDSQLKSCSVCKCLMRLKVWTPLHFILENTKPEVMEELPSHCWIVNRDA